MDIKAKNCMVDWLEFSVFGVTEHVILKTLGIERLVFDIKRGFYYNRVLSFDNIIQISSEFKGNGGKEHIHVKITGKGCRLLERIYDTTDLREELRYRLLLTDLKVSRMDIAVDYNMKFVIDFFETVLNERVKGVKTVEHVGSLKSGLTLYLGSRKSEKFYRLYEKDFETGDFANYKDRLELVLKNEYATFEFFNENSLIKIVSTYMDDIEFKEKDREELWTSMKNEKCEISPKIRHKKTTLKEKGEYILNTYGNTLKAYAEEFGTKDITKAISEAVLSEKDLRMIQNEKVIKMAKYRRESALRKNVDTEKSENNISENHYSKVVKYVQMAL